MKWLPKPDVAPAPTGGLSDSTHEPSAPPSGSSLWDDGGRGFGIAYAYLNRRERTVAEVTARLQQAEINEDEIERVLEELLRLGSLDDARYARAFAEDKRNLEQWGNERITRSLRERGVAREVIVGALSGLADHDEHGQALELIERRFPGGPTQARDRDRAFGVLIRKGYDSETAADAVRRWAAGA